MANDRGPCIICQKRPRRVRTPICQTCAGNHYYWEKKIEKFGVQVVIDRQHQIEIFHERMLYWGGQKDQLKGFKDAARYIKRRTN